MENVEADEWVAAVVAIASADNMGSDEMAGATPASAASLPRFVQMAEEGLAGRYLAVEMYGARGPYLAFSAQSQTRLAAHELQWNADEKGVVAIRAGNGRFWRRDAASGFVLPDRDTVPRTPPSSDPDCYFRLFRLPSSGNSQFSASRLLLQPYDDSIFVQRDTVSSAFFDDRTRDFPENSLVSVQGNDRNKAILQVSSAAAFAVVLPHYIVFKGDNARYMGYYLEDGKNWLKFQYKEPVLSTVQEVFQLANGNIAVRNVEKLKFWRRSPNWIRADVDELAEAAKDIECQFDVVKLSSTMIAFISAGNGRLLKRYSNHWDDCLCANGNTVNDTTTRLLLQEAVLSRSSANHLALAFLH